MTIFQHQAQRRRENFPVASRLLPQAVRADVLALYDFCRGADDISDNPAISLSDRATALDALRAQLQGDDSHALPPWAEAYYARVRAGRLSGEWGLRLLSAFRQDTECQRYDNMNALIDYCERSAVPVGRALMELCAEPTPDTDALDALCIALQLLNHARDVGSDYRQLGRIYLPQDWLRDAGVNEQDLGADACGASLRVVIDRLLDATWWRLQEAEHLPATIQSRRLRGELRMMIAVARHLCNRLRVADPLAGRCPVGMKGWLRALFVLLPWHTSRSHFRLPMRLLPRTRRHAMQTLYRFCRRMDDIADDPLRTQAEKEAALVLWQQRVTQWQQGAVPDHPLLQDMQCQGLGECHAPMLALIEGMRMDVVGMVQPSESELLRYMRCVAGEVGVMATVALRCESAASHAYALALGEALQRINILRDVVEDADAGRLYLPREWLHEAGLADMAPAQLTRRLDAIRPVLWRWHREAAAALAASWQQVPVQDAHTLAPAFQMAAIYGRLLDQMAADGLRYRSRYRVGLWGKISGLAAGWRHARRMAVGERT